MKNSIKHHMNPKNQLASWEVKLVQHMMRHVTPHLELDGFNENSHFVYIEADTTSLYPIKYRYAITRRARSMEPISKRKKRFWWLPFRKVGGVDSQQIDLHSFAYHMRKAFTLILTACEIPIIEPVTNDSILELVGKLEITKENAQIVSEYYNTLTKNGLPKHEALELTIVYQQDLFHNETE